MHLAWKAAFSSPDYIKEEFHLLQPCQVDSGYYRAPLDDKSVAFVIKGQESLDSIPEPLKSRSVLYADLSDEQKALLK